MRKYYIGAAILGGLALFGYSIYRYVKTQSEVLKDFKWQIKDIRFTTFSFSSIKGRLKILFSSKSDIEFVIESFYVDFFFNDKQVGLVDSNDKFIVPANSSTEIGFDFVLNPRDIITNIADIALFTTKAKDAKIKMVGFAKVKSNFVRVTVPIDYETTVKELLK
jgi:hypothetical protein